MDTLLQRYFFHPVTGGYSPQQWQQDEEQQGKSVPKQKPRTLDSRFAQVKEERMRVFSDKNNAVQRNGNGGWQSSPSTRRQFDN
ncbi:hypothetical protein SLEP1_g40356 [Rubroshorea leprosula]|uniref:Uncharacterized protein n=1 Tax=Rubroshorea leprosula TaxID=152421 RepID=A0AAV5L3B5_9ROSI|nr:hypothetical protein SLEP1_g40356 [Rubroshorea leprosula]